MSCQRAGKYFARKGITVRESVDARKIKIGPSEALKLVNGAKRVKVACGKKIEEWSSGKVPAKDEILKLILGRSQTLRAPTARLANGLLLIGFNDALYE